MDNFFFKWPSKQREVIAPQEKEQPANLPSGADFRARVVTANSESASLKIAAVYRAVDVISNSMAQLCMEYQRQNRAQNYFVTDLGPTRGRNLNYLCQVRPNSRMNAVQFWRNLSQQTILQGNAYVVPVRGISGEIESLQLITSGSVAFDEYNNTYLINDPLNGICGSYGANDIIHIRNTFTTANGLTGISTLSYASRVLSIAATNDQQTLETAAKGGRVKLLMQRKQEQTLGFGKVKKQEMEKAAAKLNEDIYNSDVAFLNGEGTITPITMTAVEQQLLESRKFSLAEIARLFGVPRNMLFDDSNSSYKTPEAATIDFMSRTLAPRIREIENEFNAKLLDINDFGSHRFHLCERNLFALDLTSQAAWNKSRIETGLASVNELRAEANMPSIENGDDHYVSTNLAIAGSTKLSGDNTTASADQIDNHYHPSTDGEGGEL